MAKTIKQISDEIGVTKQTVYKRFKGKLYAACAPYAHTVDGILYIDEVGEQIIKDDFENTYCSNRDILERSNISPVGAVERSIGAVSSDVEKKPKNQGISSDFCSESEFPVSEKIPLERSNFGVERSNGAPVGVPQNDCSKTEYVAEIEFLRRQIDRLQDELEKEREHNREKDRQLLDTLTKLAETQAALAVGQSAEKQKALAETLIEGQQIMDGERGESVDKAAEVYAGFDDEFREKPKKRGVLQRVWDAITGKG